MPLGFSVAAVSVSGSDVPVVSRTFNGIGPCRLYMKNTGGEALTACKIQAGAVSGAMHDLDTTTFAALAAGETLSLRLLGPVDVLTILATCAAGTTLSAWLADSPEIVG